MIDQKIYIGTDSFANLSNLLKEFSSKRVLILRGKKSFDSCGAKDILYGILTDLQCVSYEFWDFAENPKIREIEGGLSIVTNNQIDTIIAIGGGSVIDMAKLIRFFYSYDGSLSDGKFVKKRELLRLIAIPTTAGTGSEVTQFAVAYKDKLKYSIDHVDILPDVAIVYPPFTYNNPEYLTACTGFDALSQAIESYWSVNANEESLSYATKAIQKIWNNLPLLLSQPTHTLRNEIAEGAYWAGKAINITRTTAAHALSYPFTSHYGYPHGHAVALAFPLIFDLNIHSLNNISSRINVNEYTNRILELLKLLSCNMENATQVISDYVVDLGLVLKRDSTMAYDIDLLMSGVNPSRLKNNPMDMNTLQLREIMSKIVM